MDKSHNLSNLGTTNYLGIKKKRGKPFNTKLLCHIMLNSSRNSFPALSLQSATCKGNFRQSWHLLAAFHFPGGTWPMACNTGRQETQTAERETVNTSSTTVKKDKTRPCFRWRALGLFFRTVLPPSCPQAGNPPADG